MLFDTLKPILRDDMSDKQKLHVMENIQESVVRYIESEQDIIWADLLVNDPAKFFKFSDLDTFHSLNYNVFDFLLMRCNHFVLNIIFSMFKKHVFVLLSIVAGVFSDVKLISRAFPSIAASEAYRNVVTGNFIALTQAEYFDIFYTCLSKLAKTKYKVQFDKLYKHVPTDQAFALYSKCVERDIVVPNALFTAIPVTAEIYELILATQYPKRTLTFRIALEKTTKPVKAALRTKATGLFNDKDYAGYLRIVLWLGDHRPLLVPNDVSEYANYTHAILNVKLDLLPVETADLVGQTLNAMNNDKYVNAFFFLYIKCSMPAKEKEASMYLYWKYRQERIFAIGNPMYSIDRALSIAHIVVGATKAGLLHTDKRVQNFLVNRLSEYHKTIEQVNEHLADLQHGPVALTETSMIRLDKLKRKEREALTFRTLSSNDGTMTAVVISAPGEDSNLHARRPPRTRLGKSKHT